MKYKIIYRFASILLLIFGSSAFAQDSLTLYAAQQSSTNHGGLAARAIDGNTNGTWANGSVTHTQNQEHPWWQAELQESINISEVTIWNRTDCCSSRLSKFYLIISSQPFDADFVYDARQPNNQHAVFEQYVHEFSGNNVTIPVDAVGRYIRVQIGTKGVLSLAEVEVKGASAPSNSTELTLSGAAQSSNAYGGVAARAIDGNTNGVWANGSVTHTQNEEHPWWQAELQESANISEVTIWNRTNCCSSRLSKFYLIISSQPFDADFVYDARQPNNQHAVFEQYVHELSGNNVTIPVNAVGRYIRVQIGTKGVLSLAEVEVKGASAPSSSTELTLSGAAQSSNAHGGVAARAIDGNTNGTWANGSVTHTQNQENPWWSATLAANADISEIQIWNRTDSCCRSRLSNFYVFVSEQPINSNSSISGLINDSNVSYHYNSGTISGDSISIPINQSARYVRVQLNQWGALSLAEVKVFGSSNGGPVNPPGNSGEFTKTSFGNSYIGSFKLPGDLFTDSFSGKGLTVSPDGNYLYTTTQVGASTSANANSVVARVAIPSSFNAQASGPSGVVYDQVDISGALLENSAFATGASPRWGFSDNRGLIEDLTIHNNSIIGTFAVQYDTGDPTARNSHFVIDTLNLSAVGDGNVTGLFEMSNNLNGLTQTDGTDAGFLAGYMTEIPQEHVNSFAPFTHLTGRGGGSIISRTNTGPGAYLFNANTVGSSNPDLEPIVHCPTNNPCTVWKDVFVLGETYTQMQDYAVFNHVTTVNGAFFVPGTDKVVFVGSGAATSTNVNGYELGSAVTYYGNNDSAAEQPNDSVRPYTTAHSVNGNYEFQMWVYNVSDYKQVLLGNVGQESLKPVDEFRFDFGYAAPGGEVKLVGGAALHESSGRLYMLEITKSGEPHVVHVYDMN